jgi:hypothetical protein
MNWVRVVKRTSLRASAGVFLFAGTVIAADSDAEIILPESDVLGWSANTDMTISNLDTTMRLTSAYIDIPINLTFVPYAGMGLGWGWVEGAGEDGLGLAYGLIAGTVFELSGSFALNTGYRFREIILEGDNFTDHSITAGALFRF